MPLSKLQTNARVGDQAYEALHNAIVTGEYAAGRRLQIRDLAAELGISVMPVREAIKRLEEVGLVETQPYKGAVVKEVTQEELLQIYAVRRLLEVEAARAGASLMRKAGIARLKSLYKKLVKAIERDDVVEYLDLDEEMLTEIYSASGNKVLVETIRSLWDRCRFYKIVGARGEMSDGIVAHLLEYQQELIEVIEAGDVDGAARITEDSLDAATKRITVAMAK